MDELRKDYMYIVFVKIWELKKILSLLDLWCVIKSKVKGIIEINCCFVLIW